MKNDGRMRPAAKAFRGEEEEGVMPGRMRTRAASAAEAHFTEEKA